MLEQFKQITENFYPRSPYGERHSYIRRQYDRPQISIHALLTESDAAAKRTTDIRPEFLSTLSLRRATCFGRIMSASSGYFYPRSPYGERLGCFGRCRYWAYFYPRSPYGERLTMCILCSIIHYFYPRSPYGERPAVYGGIGKNIRFLSTLSLRRATVEGDNFFYYADISIHALLTESDNSSVNTADQEARISIHALLTESDKRIRHRREKPRHFYPRSPYGERHAYKGV